MRRHIMSLWSLSLLLAACECNQYHYQKPHIPFVSNGAAPQAYGPPPAAAYAPAQAPAPAVANLPVLTTVVRTLGPAGKAYEVHLSGANQIYEGRQVTAVPFNAAASSGYLHAAAATNHGYAGAQVGAGAYSAPAAGANVGYAGGAAGHFTGGHNAAAVGGYTAGYVGGATAAGHANFNSNLQYSPNPNPLLQQQYAAPQSPVTNVGANSYGAPTAQFNQGSYTQSYAQSSGGVQGGAANLGAQQGVPGDYVAQSQASQLDHYPEKQQPIGETRAYARLITTCYGSGQCQQQQLGPGQVDPQHQQTVASARAQIAPVSDKCRMLSEQRSAAAAAIASGSANAAANLPNDPNYAGGSYYNKQGPKRPKDRRLFAYTETEIAKDPFN